jgi:hypothetical protein
MIDFETIEKQALSMDRNSRGRAENQQTLI